MNLRYRERRVLDVSSRRALADVDQPRLIAIDQRPQQHTPHHAEDGGIGANAERQSEDDGQEHALRAGHRANGEPKLVEEAHKAPIQPLLEALYVRRIARAAFSSRPGARFRPRESHGDGIRDPAASAPPRIIASPVALTPGTRIGVYEVTAQIGEGGPPSLAHEASELRRGLAVAQRGSTW